MPPDTYYLSLHDALPILGNVMAAQGRSKEAEGRIREAISIWERVRGPEDPSVAPGLLNLGILLQARKEYDEAGRLIARDRKSTRLNSSHPSISYAVFCLK